MATRVQFEFEALADGVRPRGLAPAGIMRWARLAAKRWRERRLLRQLDDRMLHDIGVSRGDALEEARKPFWVP